MSLTKALTGNFLLSTQIYVSPENVAAATLHAQSLTPDDHACGITTVEDVLHAWAVVGIYDYARFWGKAHAAKVAA